MALKNNAQVIIDGEICTLSGYEDIEYLNKVASYLNNKLSEIRSGEGFKSQSKVFQNMLIYVNIADDYYKARKSAEAVEAELEAKNKEIYNLKHELINLQLKQEEYQKEITELRAAASELEKKIIRLETKAEQEEHRKEE